MLENTNYELPETGLVMETSINLESIEDFMSAFGITQIATQKDEGLLSKESCRKRILKEIEINIQNFKNDGWSKENQMHKLLTELKKKDNVISTIFSVRLGGKRIYRCSCGLLNKQQKIEFLTKFYEAISKGILDEQIENFCENEVKLKEKRKQASRLKKKLKRAEEKAKKEAEEKAAAKAQEEAMKHLPKVA